MPITVKLFAGLKAKHGSEVTIPLDAPCSVAQAEESLRERSIWLHGSRIAVNHLIRAEGDTIEPGDEVALIPPVSGGLL